MKYTEYDTPIYNVSLSRLYTYKRSDMGIMHHYCACTCFITAT